METHSYQVDVNWMSDRKGMMSSPDLNVQLEVATPPQFPKGMPGIWSPEHLFTAAVGSCLMTTFLSIAENSKLEYSSIDIKASGKLDVVDGKYLMTKVELYPTLTIQKEGDRDRALRILQKSEAACLISNSIKSEVVMRPEVLVD